MTEYRFEGAEYFATEQFHEDREAADHLHEPGHMARLWCVAGIVNDIIWRQGHDLTIIDYGCGNGGLLSLLHSSNAKGYDFQPANVTQAQQLGRNVEHRDFVNNPDRSNIAIMTEVLEHMDDPHGFLRNLECNILVASVPLGETPEHHYEYHVWGWDGDGFANMLTANGYAPFLAMPVGPTQVWAATK